MATVNVAYDLAESLLNDIVEVLPKTVGRMVVAPGTQPAWDDCCLGQLAIRTVNIAVKNSTPRPPGCKHQGYTYTFGVSVLRCAAVLDERGRAPSPSQISKDADLMFKDMEAIQQFLECDSRIFRMMSWTPLGVTGGCHGGEWIFTVFQEPYGCCDQEAPHD